jgi:hypothetical protein
LSVCYQWKKIIGDINDREVIVNRWNTEIPYTQTPDYYQSFGLGFFEYFQLAEDIGTEPLPIINCGMSDGICGSDIHYYKEGNIGNPVVKYAFTIGHEGAGIIEKIGKSVKNVKIGDRVAIDPAMLCFTCDQCKSGRYHTCRKIRFLGCTGQSEGCMAEYMIMPAYSCFPLKKNISFDQAALSKPLSIGLYATRLSV